MLILMQDVSDVGNLVKELKEVTHWFKLGLHLGLPEHHLKRIEKENKNTEICKTKMLIQWKRSKSAEIIFEG